jgi:hypothetical protein
MTKKIVTLHDTRAARRARFHDNKRFGPIPSLDCRRSANLVVRAISPMTWRPRRYVRSSIRPCCLAAA